MVNPGNGPIIKVGYSVFDFLSDIAGAMEQDTVMANSQEYTELLNTIRSSISENHANTLNSILTDPNARSVLMPIILNYVTDYVNNTNDVSINISRTAERIYQDMAGFGILTPYLNDPSVEEININAWNAIYIVWAGRSKPEQIEETFSTPQECVDVIKKMVRIGGVHIDYSQPIIDSYIGNGVRISATLPPVNTEEIGATASIRKQTYSNVTREKYLAMGFASEALWDFNTLALTHGVSIGAAGSPGAGKTTWVTCMLKEFMAKTLGNNRVISVEEAREIQLDEYEDENPSGGYRRMTSPTIAWNTTSGQHPVTARMLVRHALRMNPGILVPAEMRGPEALEVVEGGQTGVQIISTFHALNAIDGYFRILSMCQMAANNAAEASLMKQIITAFPLMVYIKKDDDGVRRIHEVFEPTAMESGHIEGNMIFRFIRTKVEEDENGRIVRIYGDFVQTASISKKLRRLLIQNGARREEVDRYYFEGENPNNIEKYDDMIVEVVTVSSVVPEPVFEEETEAPAETEIESEDYMTAPAEEVKPFDFSAIVETEAEDDAAAVSTWNAGDMYAGFAAAQEKAPERPGTAKYAEPEAHIDDISAEDIVADDDGSPQFIPQVDEAPQWETAPRFDAPSRSRWGDLRRRKGGRDE